MSLIEAAQEYRDAADWLIECEKDVRRRKVVRGLSEAREGYLTARRRLDAALDLERGHDPDCLLDEGHEGECAV